jgi:hypothetical protein
MAQPGEGEPSEAAEQMAGLEEALEQLRQEHAAQLDEVDEALRDALPAEERQALQERLRDTARRVREAVEGSPAAGERPRLGAGGGGRGALAGRGDGGRPREGRSRPSDRSGAARHGLARSGRATRSRGAAGSSEREVGEAAGQARGALDELMREGRARSRRCATEASKGARGALEKAPSASGPWRSARASSARRAPRARRRSRSEMLDRLEDAAQKMDEAARELGQGEGARAQNKQQEAQRLLEMSQPERDGDGGKSRREGDGKDFARDADVPPEARDKRAEDFRRRVTEGLGKDAPPHLREAIRRYTEGLLR